MTTFRFRSACLGLIALAAASCGQETQPIEKILHSSASDEELLERFGARIDYLSSNIALFDQEFSAAGFTVSYLSNDPVNPASKCGTYRYAAPNSELNNQLRAFVSFCKDGARVMPKREGIRRGALSED